MQRFESSKGWLPPQPLCCQNPTTAAHPHRALPRAAANAAASRLAPKFACHAFTTTRWQCWQHNASAKRTSTAPSCHCACRSAAALGRPSTAAPLPRQPRAAKCATRRHARIRTPSKPASTPTVACSNVEQADRASPFECGRASRRSGTAPHSAVLVDSIIRSTRELCSSRPHEPLS